MDTSVPEGLIEHFSKLEDPRVDRNKKHELIDVIVLCVCAVLSGAEGWCDIEEFGRAKLDWLRRYVPLTNGIPVDDTIARIISALSVSGFQECFLSWMEDVVKLSDGEIIALDGKTHRRTHDRKRGVKALHMVSAWASRNGVVLGQVKTDEKSNEITAVPELLEKLELKGCIVTLCCFARNFVTDFSDCFCSAEARFPTLPRHRRSAVRGRAPAPRGVAMIPAVVAKMGGAPRPSLSNGQWASVLGAEDSELEVVVVVVEEIELPVRARAFVHASLVVVAGDVGEVLVLERAGDAVEEFEGVGGGLVAELIGHEVQHDHSRSSATACSMCSAVTVRAPCAAAAVSA